MHGSDAEAIHSPNGLVSTDAGAVAAQLDLEFEQRSRGVLHGAGGVTEVELPTTIVKRDGRVVPFDPMRIERAMNRCFAALGRAVGLRGATVRTSDDLDAVKRWLDDGALPGMVLDAKVVPTVVAEWLEEAFRGH